METTGEKRKSKQFAYCSFCRLSHKKWKKHVYSKRHQDIMLKILEKFGSKVNAARESSSQPTIEGASFEKEAKVWCYFCSEDIDKHTHKDSYTIKYGSFIDHLNSDNHVLMTNKFLHSNLLDKNKLSQLVMDDVQLKSFRENAAKAVQIYEQKIVTDLKKETEKIRCTEHSREVTLKKRQREVCDEQGVISRRHSRLTQSLSHECVSGPSTPDIRHPFRRTLTAKGQGLTCILKDEADAPDEGNVFSGAVPPWLRPDPEPDPGHREIGPTLQDLHKHLESEKKKKLPPNRVGAHFDHSAVTPDNWLPSFGRVWSKGRRLQSKSFFENQSKRGRGRGFYSSRTNKECSARSVPTSLQPYQRKRLPSATITTATNTSQRVSSPCVPSTTGLTEQNTPQTYSSSDRLLSGVSGLGFQATVSRAGNSGLANLNMLGQGGLESTFRAPSCATGARSPNIRLQTVESTSANFHMTIQGISREAEQRRDVGFEKPSLPSAGCLVTPYKRKRHV